MLDTVRPGMPVVMFVRGGGWPGHARGVERHGASLAAQHVPHLLCSTGELLQVAADLGHLPELLNLREGVGQGDCLAVGLSQEVLVAVKEPTPNSRPAAAAANTLDGVYPSLKSAGQRHDAGLRNDPEGDAGRLLGSAGQVSQLQCLVTDGAL